MNNKKLYSITFVSNIFKLFVNIILGIITVPISIDYWQSEKYGIWLLINSILVYLTASNLGLNAASSILMNKENSNFKKIIILKKSFYIVLFSSFILILIFILMNYYNSSWILFLGKIDNRLLDEAQKASFILILFFLFNIPFSLFSSAFNGFHKVYIENIIVTINSIFLFVALIVNIKLSGNLILFAFLIGLSNLIINLVRGLYFYLKIYKDIKKDESNETFCTEYCYRNILFLGLRCFSGSVASMIALNTDNLVISHFLGVEFVTPYAVTFKLFTILFNLIFIINSSLVPILGRLIGKNDYHTANKIYKYTSFLTMYIGGGIFIGSLAFFKNLIFMWSGETGYAGTGTLLFLGAYSYIFCVVNLNYIIINTFNYIKGSMWIIWGEALLNLSLSIILSFKFGITGIAIGTFLGALVFPGVFFPIIITKRSEKKLEYDKRFFIKHSLIVLAVVIVAFYVHLSSINIIINLLLTLMLIIVYSVVIYSIHDKETKLNINKILNSILKKRIKNE